ncbi:MULTISPECIES: hypothetical protein [Shewanella]|uniref:Magnesium transporter n=1 Tax=Shewanella japonica TaxID=93973 RepID=A0ABN4YIQ4_9GAMM|nr:MULTISPECIES: hypothetical protein [Shewanella]ARD23024.1 hypothetical protein SJ2017_2741 [Shewanella japonica]KPZ68133.1 hypothetical protein AN944_03713 [Shewanella sp. P1-14-1]
MTDTVTTTHPNTQSANGFFARHKAKFFILLALITVALGSVFLASGFTVHHQDIPADYWTTTSALKDKFLDTEVFIGALTMMLIVTICLAIWGYWKLHSLPKKYAAHTGQAKLVFWLCTIGFFYNELWIAAILIVVTDWKKISAVIKARQA